MKGGKNWHPRMTQADAVALGKRRKKRARYPAKWEPKIRYVAGPFGTNRERRRREAKGIYDASQLPALLRAMRGM